MSRRRHVRPREWDLLDPVQGGWLCVYRRERLYADRHLSSGNMYRLESGDLQRLGSMSRRRHVRRREWYLLEPVQVGWLCVYRRERLYADRHLSSGNMYRLESGDLQ